MEDRFINDADEVRDYNLSVAGRNELDVNHRVYMETQLVPGLLAVLALPLGFSPEDLERDFPARIDSCPASSIPAHLVATGLAILVGSPECYGLNG